MFITNRKNLVVHWNNENENFLMKCGSKIGISKLGKILKGTSSMKRDIFSSALEGRNMHTVQGFLLWETDLHRSVGHRLFWLGSRHSGQESRTTGAGTADSPHYLPAPGLLWQRWWTPCPLGCRSWPCGHCRLSCTACHSASSIHLLPKPTSDLPWRCDIQCSGLSASHKQSYINTGRYEQRKEEKLANSLFLKSLLKNHSTSLRLFWS